MSLDVYLRSPVAQTVEPVERIFVRENGSNREITREEWDAKFPGCEPVTVRDNDSVGLFSANITHNLNAMADAAGIYKCLWRPDEIGITKARQLIEPLRVGLELLRSDPPRFQKLNPENGWGNYDGLVQFVSDYLDACEAHPDADVSVWR